MGEFIDHPLRHDGLCLFGGSPLEHERFISGAFVWGLAAISATY